MREQSILILGASSWLGYLCANKLSQQPANRVFGTVRSGSVSLPAVVTLFEAARIADYEELFANQRASVVINFLRGEDEVDLDLHRMVTKYCMDHSALYVYASSVLALDAYEDQELVESLPAKSVSPYGIFKAQCESHLLASGAQHLILRFASVQGWVEHRKTRNESFLQKVSSGKPVTVDTGILQNRLYANDLVDMLLALIDVQARGVLHLGTSDSSSEVDFLRREALAFGWNPDLVIEGEPRNVNLVAVPNRVFKLIGDSAKRLESDTIASLLSCDGLKKYARILNG